MQRHDFLRNSLLYVCHRFWIGICRNTFFHVEPQRTCLIKILYWTKSNWRCSDDSSISSRAFEHGFQPPSSPEHMCVTHNTVFIYSYYLFCSFLFEFNNKNKFFDVKTFSSFFSIFRTRGMQSVYLSFATGIHWHRFSIDVFAVRKCYFRKSFYWQTNESVKVFWFCVIW